MHVSVVGRQSTCAPKPGSSLNFPYVCHPLMIHGSILSLSLGKICTRMPLKNHGVLSDVYDGKYIQFSKLSYENKPTYDMKMPASTLMPLSALMCTPPYASLI